MTWPAAIVRRYKPRAQVREYLASWDFQLIRVSWRSTDGPDVSAATIGPSGSKSDIRTLGMPHSIENVS
jgi:hypothetical protein